MKNLYYWYISCLYNYLRIRIFRNKTAKPAIFNQPSLRYMSGFGFWDEKSITINTKLGTSDKLTSSSIFSIE